MNASPRTLALLSFVMCGVYACSGGGGGGHHGGGGGGGGGGGNNPTPTITSLAPGAGFTADASSAAGSQMLTINGTNFVSGATVSWSGTALGGATFVNSGQLTVAVPANQLNASYTATVVVTNPAPGGGNSNAMNFAVNPPKPGAPAFMPGSVSQLSGGFQLMVSATNVLYNSSIVWNYGAPNAFYLFDTLTTPPAMTGGTGTLTAVIPNGLIASQGVVQVAVVNYNADGSVTTAVSQANFTISAPSPPLACLLAGTQNFAFVAGGSDTNGAVSMVGSFRIDATGAVINNATPVNSVVDFKDPTQLLAVDFNSRAGQMNGAAGSCLDTTGVPGTGKLTFTVNGIAGDTFTLNYALRNAGNAGRITLTSVKGVNATGHVQIQYKPTAFGAGSFGFGLLGESASAQRLAVIGAVCTSGQAPFLQADFDAAGTVSTGTVPAGWAANPPDASTGRTLSSQLNFSNGSSLYVLIYGVGGGKAFAMEASPVGTSTQVLSGVITGFKGLVCMPTGAGGVGTFSNSSVANSVFGLATQGAGTSAAILGVVNNVAPGGGGSCAAGQGSASLTADENVSGAGGAITATPACYSVAATGRGTLTYTDPLTAKAESGTFYLDGVGNGYLIGQGASVPFGFIEAQAAPAPLPAIGGNYSFGVFDFPTALLPVTSVAIMPSSATAGTIADNAAGGSCNGAPCAYTLDTTTGRGTATLNSATTFGSAPVVFYESANDQIYIMGAQPTATPVLGALLQ